MAVIDFARIKASQAKHRYLIPVQGLHLASACVDAGLTASEPVWNDPGAT